MVGLNEGGNMYMALALTRVFADGVRVHVCAEGHPTRGSHPVEAVAPVVDAGYVADAR